MRDELPAALVAFLHDKVKPADFRHADHVRVAFELLRRHDFVDSASACVRGLKRIAARAGRPEAFHTTITLAFLSVIAERLAESATLSFEAFAAANPDLMDPGILKRWYRGERLSSPLARRTFVLPDAVA